MDNNLNPSGVPQPGTTPQAGAAQQPPQYLPAQPPTFPPQQYAPPQFIPPQQYAPPQQFIPTQQFMPQPQNVPAPQQQPFAPQPQNIPPEQQPDGRPVYPPIDRRILQQCRHKAEKRWYRRLFVLNILIIVIAIGYFIYSMEDNQKYFDDVYNYFAESISAASNGDENAQTSDSKTEDGSDTAKAGDQTLEEAVGKTPENIEYLVMVIFTIIAIPFVVSYAYAQYRSMSVRITEKTYPEIYAIVEEYAQKLGMKRVPKVYMVQGNGVLNAFSSFIPFRQYIEVYADLLEVAYREYHDMDTIRFIIAHEMAHIYYKHATMHYYYGMMFSQLIPIVGETASRAREYSCDRLAQLLSGSDGMDAMMTFIAGIHLYKQVDKVDYVKHALEVKGFFLFCYNLMCSHPVMTKRVIALADPERKSGKLY